jgi:DNA (cytosine-5)-methyltransferase 1
VKYISLFSGIGGFDIALGRAGFVCDTVCENDKQAQYVLRRRFPEARLIDGIT